jgi:cytoskeletal protein CcmA (bactofilin family)
MFRWKKNQPGDKSGDQTEAPSDGEPPAPAGAGNDGDTSEISAPPLKPFTRKGTHTPTKPPAAPSFHPAPPRRTPPDIPGVAPRISELASIGGQDSKRLVIGRDISISGEVNACDRLLVEGRAEIALPNTDQLEITHSGFFQGSADVRIADISGRFEGDLFARDQLIVRAGGRLSGTVRYGHIIIEAGGQVTGDIQALDGEEADTASNGKEDKPAKPSEGKSNKAKPKAGKQ